MYYSDKRIDEFTFWISVQNEPDFEDGEFSLSIDEHEDDVQDSDLDMFPKLNLIKCLFGTMFGTILESRHNCHEAGGRVVTDDTPIPIMLPNNVLPSTPANPTASK